MLHDVARRLKRTPSAGVAAELLESCLGHPRELPRVAAAASYFQVSDEPRRLLEILEEGTRSDDPLVRQLAATGLARVAPESRRLQELTRSREPRGGDSPSRTALLVHGTFARDVTWWQPGGEFHTYLRDNVRPDLYGATDRFEWSGGYSDAARAVGAADLHDWIAGHALAGLDVFTHSHGGSVAMTATHLGARLGKLVLLSCPVHASKYLPEFAQVREVISIRVHLDLIILLDGGGQRFRHPRIREHVLPIWFDHSATHDPDVWRAHDVKRFV
ncbi:MAG TPA: alpha/beta hydrolase [Methylomirabilota bacterium]|nr:alpha/beta hydrolase [Methylomirabilota bacterium]